MSLRHQWEFEFPANKLMLASSKKKDHHEQRVRFWEDAKSKVMQEVKDTGIEVSESVGYGTSSGGGFTPQVMVKSDLQTKLSECHKKISEHRTKANEYAGWMQVFSSNSESRLKLNADDYLYFFGDL